MAQSFINPEALPKIDCLMVTLPVPERFDFAQTSIEDYCRQTYPNKKLILVLDRGVDAARQTLCDHVASLRRDDIEVVVPSIKLNLGELRNLSMETATADFVCQWDDDDRSHPQRLEAQAGFLQAMGLDAVYLQDLMQYFPSAGALYWTNWRATPAGGHPGTLMARRSDALRYPTEGGSARLGEDLALALALRERGRVGYLAEMAHLFVYVSHGANSWDDAHHKMLSSELSISKGLLKRREATIREGLAPYRFAPESVTVSGNNGPAFKL
jgi:glycosyltransferase involved in cell wall biosynthesis